MAEKKSAPFTDGCRVCGSTDERLRRGLCQKHYRRFTGKRDAFATDEERTAFEAMCIERGWVDPKQTGGRPRELDPFDALVAEVQAEFAADIAAALAKEEARQAAERAKKPTTARGKRKAN